jgi:hypothetical protein
MVQFCRIASYFGVRRVGYRSDLVNLMCRASAGGMVSLQDALRAEGGK